MDYKLILDVIVSALLAATISYAVLLNRKLVTLRKNRDDLAKLIGSFNDATMRAEASIPKLRRAADEAGTSLQDRVEKAQSLRDDLAFMIERADAMANRLESSVRQARSESKPSPKARAGGSGGGSGSGGGGGDKPQPVADKPSTGLGVEDFGGFDDERSEAERELLRALQSVR